MEVSSSGNFSKLAHAGDLARRRVGPAAAANSKRCAGTAAHRLGAGVGAGAGAGCWVLGAGCWVLGAGRWVLVAGCWVLGASC